MVIKSVKARQIFDSRGNPTVEDMFFVLYGDIIRLRGEFQVEVVLDDGTFTTVAVPIGASTEKVKKSKKKHAELLMKDEESPPKLDQEFGDQRKVAKTPPEKVKESKKKHAELLKEKEESAPKPYREFGDQRKVAKRPPENVDPQTEKVKESKKKHAELLREKEESAPKPYREFGDQRKVAKTPPENVDPQTEKVKKSKKIQHELLRKEEESPTKPDREFSDQLKVAKTPPDHISKPMAIKVHDCYLAHDHKLELKSYNDPFKCSRCKEDGFTLGYGCKLCDYNLHKECWNPKPKITHKLFPGSTFEFCEKPLECRRICDECDNYRRICDACGTRIYGCSYHCKAHGWDLHPRCGNLPKQLRSNGMDFVLISKIVKQRCFWCKEKLHSQLVEKEVPGWWYVSKPNGFYCHVYCVFQIVLEAWKRGALVRNDDDDDNDGTSKALEKVNLKHVAKSNGSGGRGGRWFSMLTAILKIIVGVLSGDPTGWIVLAAELLQN